TIAFIALIAAAVYALATLSNGTQATGETTRRLRYMGLSCALAAYLLTLAWDVFLDRYPYLWGEHQTFSGVTYTEDHFVLPGLMIVAVALIVGAGSALLNAFTRRGRLLLIVSVALPAAVYLVSPVLLPTYVQGFIVKPNELARETPYIEQNINWTRQSFQLDHVAAREFDADPAPAAFDIN